MRRHGRELQPHWAAAAAAAAVAAATATSSSMSTEPHGRFTADRSQHRACGLLTGLADIAAASALGARRRASVGAACPSISRDDHKTEHKARWRRQRSNGRDWPAAPSGPRGPAAGAQDNRRTTDARKGEQCGGGGGAERRGESGGAMLNDGAKASSESGTDAPGASKRRPRRPGDGLIRGVAGTRRVKHPCPTVHGLREGRPRRRSDAISRRWLINSPASARLFWQLVMAVTKLRTLKSPAVVVVVVVERFCAAAAAALASPAGWVAPLAHTSSLAKQSRRLLETVVARLCVVGDP
uniref:Uncharacterized protein n=1 Tax=Plectus sambesii TaxID=2011161 RepID=A0A914WWM4_9BILA